MSEQRLKILEMLSEGKVTVEEAQKLLSAVSDSDAAAREPKHVREFRPYVGVQAEEGMVGKLAFDVQGQTVDVREIQLSAVNLAGAELDGVQLEGADLSGTNLKNADLTDADLRGANLSGSILVGANFRGADLRDANLSGSYLPGADFEGLCHPGLNLSAVHLPGWKFRGDREAEETEPSQEQAQSQPVKVVVNSGDRPIVAALRDTSRPFQPLVKPEVAPSPEPKPGPMPRPEGE